MARQDDEDEDITKIIVFKQISSEEINQNSLRLQLFQTLKEVKLLVLIWQAIV